MSLTKKRVSSPGRLPGVFVHSPFASGAKAWAVIGTLLALVGISDFFSGIEISLAIFYLVPIALATAWHGRKAGIGVAVLCTITRIGSDLLTVYPQPLPVHTWWNAAASLVIFAFIVWLLSALVALHRQLEQRVAERTSELLESVTERERLQRDLLDIGARERSAIGRELHDELGQHLVATALAAQVLAQKTPDVAGSHDARNIVQWIEAAIAKTRKLARGLLLSRIEPARFAQELEELAAGCTQAGVPCRVRQQGTAPSADAAECAQLFRIAQEAVSNALRHAQATAITITLATDEAALSLIVDDDGHGLPGEAGAKSAGMGLRIMEHRAKFIGATFSIESATGEGTKVICRLPRREEVAA